MSGLEILSAVAAAVQLAEICVKITASSVELFDRVKDAPDAIRKRIADLESFIDISKLVEKSSPLQTPLIATVLTAAQEDAAELLDMLRKIDPQSSTGKIGKYWKALAGVSKDKKTMAICDRLQEKKTSLILCIASINADFLATINVEMVTIRKGVDQNVQELPAIRDTVRNVTTILDGLSSTKSKVVDIHSELPHLSKKITTIYDGVPSLIQKVTLIHDELPGLRTALEKLALQQEQQQQLDFPAGGQDNSIMPFPRDADFVGREDVF